MLLPRSLQRPDADGANKGVVRIVHDAVKGRVRFRVTGLYRAAHLGSAIEDALTSNSGISGFHINTLTGRVLVFFNSGNTTGSIQALIEDVVSVAAGTQSRRIEKRGGKPKNRRQVRRGVLLAEKQSAEPWHQREAPEVLITHSVSPGAGLSYSAIAERLKRFGPNLLPESVPRSGLGIFVGQFKSLP